MKKRNIIFAVLTLIIILACIVPSLGVRIKSEQEHNGYAIALKADEKMQSHHLDKYCKSGINTVLIDEDNGKFDSRLIELCKEKNMNIALRVYVGGKKSDSYEEELDAIIKENNIKYLVLKKDKNKSGNSAPLENIIDDNMLTLVVSENVNQLSNEMPDGYNRYLNAAAGRVMRSYETLKNPLRTLSSNAEGQDAGELLYHHMINSVRDRNTEFIVLNQIDDGSGDIDTAIKQTADAAKRFSAWVEKTGYKEHKTPSLVLYKTYIPVSSAGAALIGCLMVMVIAEIIIKKRNATFEYIMLALSIAVFLLTFAMPYTLLLLYPTAFALISACFSFSVCMYVSGTAGEKFGSLKSGICVFMAAIITLAFGGCVMCSLLSGADYYLNNLIFRGVKLTLLLPVAFAAVAMWIYTDGGKIKAADIIKSIQKIKIWHIIVIVLAAAAAGIYIMRSGNAKISPLENQIRNFIAEVSGARPRTKEFVIGWPMLALMAYYSKHRCSWLLRWMAAVGSSILFASVTNTFCHVFTDACVSALRTLNGLIFSIPIIAIVLIVNQIIVKFILKK